MNDVDDITTRISCGIVLLDMISMAGESYEIMDVQTREALFSATLNLESLVEEMRDRIDDFCSDSKERKQNNE